MRVLVAVLSCLALVMLVVLAVCGVIGLAEAPVEAGVFLDAVPEYAESPTAMTALDAEYPDACKSDTHRLSCLVDLERQVEVLLTPYNDHGTNHANDTRNQKLGVRGVGVHPPRG